MATLVTHLFPILCLATDFALETTAVRETNVEVLQSLARAQRDWV